MTETEQTERSSARMNAFFDHVRVVLVGTIHSGNIGSTARAMKNMGLHRLYLVDPVEFPSREASYMSVSASDLLDTAVVVPTMMDAVGDCALVIGTSARERKIQLPTARPREMAERCVQRFEGQEIALVFGREDSGLNNEEMRLCHLHVHVPTSENYSSLNLSAAVQLLVYELRIAALDHLDQANDGPVWDSPLATAEGLERYYKHLEETLIEVGFLNPAAPRQLMARLRRLYGRIELDQMELNILRGMLTEIQKTIRGERNT